MRLPTFLVVGAAKGGTTSLHFYLRQHPDVFLPAIKETNYFWAEGAAAGRRVPRSLEAYAKCFAGAGSERAVGEVSPQYLNSTTAADRIRRELPEARIVVSLRDPAERAYSDYLGRTRTGREHRRLHEAIRPGERIFEDGRYHAKLQRYFERFPRERIHVFLYDDFRRDARGVLRAIFRFIGVDPGEPIETSVHHNVAAVPRWTAVNRLVWRALPVASRLLPSAWQGTGRVERFLVHTYGPAPPCPPDLVARLRAAYRDDVLATSALIDRDLSHWLHDGHSVKEEGGLDPASPGLRRTGPGRPS